MLGIFKRANAGLTNSRLYDNQTFYRALERDLGFCRREAVIESPFITTRRLEILLPLLRRMVARGVKVVVNTKPPQEHEDYLYHEAKEGIALLESIGVEIFYTGGHHRKLAIFDRKILWEGSLNILSQNESCEVMRRIESVELATQMLQFTKLHKYLGSI
jgi:hypothetical protein